MVRLSLTLVFLLAACAPTASQSALPSTEATPGLSAAAQVDLAASAGFRDAVTAAAIDGHLGDLLEIAEANSGIRAVGTPGFDASVDYTAGLLRAAGYTVTLDEFTIPYFTETIPALVSVTDGPQFDGGDYARAMIFSSAGTVEAPVVAVAVDPDGSPVGGGGCTTSDWEDFPAGAIAVVGPGPCYRRDQVTAAAEAGAVGLVVAYPNWPSGEVRRPTLLYPDGIAIPAVSASAEVGAALRAAAAAGGTVRLEVHTLNETRMTTNVIADRAGRVGDEVVMVGGHLDSVIDGPGINDNGSGSMTVLELALQLAALPQTERSVRFALWSGEEIGLYGSRQYVDTLGTGDRHEIVAYLNLDMIASPNFIRGIYSAVGGPPGSAQLTDLFSTYFDEVGLTWELTDVGGASDNAPFADAAIPVGGLFSGATEAMTEAQASAFGGVAGAAMSPCYHLACDTIDEVNDTVLEQLADAAAHALWVLLAEL